MPFCLLVDDEVTKNNLNWDSGKLSSPPSPPPPQKKEDFLLFVSILSHIVQKHHFNVHSNSFNGGNILIMIEREKNYILENEIHTSFQNF